MHSPRLIRKWEHHVRRTSQSHANFLCPFKAAVTCGFLLAFIGQPVASPASEHFTSAIQHTALVMLLFVIIASFSSHRYWAVEPAQVANQTSHFWKNVTIKGGLVLLFITGAGRFALDWIMGRRPS